MAKVMLVEDDNNLREIYEARLQAEGYDIVSASDGEEALAVAKNENPDLIISDVMMPKISGFEMLDILRNTTGLQDVKVIMLTALGQADDQQRADKLGADRYLVKSQVTLEDIVKAASELLEGTSEPAAPVAGIAPVVLDASTAFTTPAPVPVSDTTPSSDPAALPQNQMVAPDPVVPQALPQAPLQPSADPVPTIVTAVDQMAPVVVPGLTVAPEAVSNATPAAELQPPIQPAPVETNILSPEPALKEALSKALDEAENTANSAAEEEADVTAQIETFIAQPTATPQTIAPSEQTPQDSETQQVPQPTPQAMPVSQPALVNGTQVVEPTTVVAPPQPTQAPSPELQPTGEADNSAVPTQHFNPEESVAHDKVMEQAMESLNSPSENGPAAAAPILHPHSQTPELDSAVRNASQPAGKKIIAPLSNYDTKPDLSTLLAAEEAKEAASNAAAATILTPAPLPQPADAAVTVDPNGAGSYVAPPPALSADAINSAPVPLPQPMQVVAPGQPPFSSAPVPGPNQPQSPIDPSSIAL
jgi:CheY-like chemotaxis protein